MSAKKKKLVIIDCMAYAFRSFYAVGEMSNSKGVPTGAVFGFIHALRRAERTFKPDYAVVACDSPGGSFRDEMLKEYKGHRDAPPEDLVKQFPMIEEIVGLAGWHLLKKSRFEADDIMATVAGMALCKDIDVVLMTSDKDMLQLASEQVKIYRENPKGATLYGPKEVKERYGIGPENITDLLGLMGDSSDNIPGVPGIGEKTAMKLLLEYGTLEGVLKAAGKIAQPKLSENLKVHAKDAVLSKKLAQLEDKVPLGVKLDDLEKGELDPGFLDKLKEYEFRSLAQEYAAKLPEAPEPVEEAPKAKKRGGLKLIEAVLDEAALKRAGIKPADPVALSLHGDNLAALAQENKALVFRPKSLEDLHGLLGRFKRLVIYESKELQVRWVKAGLKPLDKVLDIEIGMYLVDSSKTVRNLSEARSALGLEDMKLKEAGDELFEPPAEEMARLAQAAWECGEAISSRMRKDGMTALYDELEGPLIPVLAQMEADGVMLDSDAVEELEKQAQKAMKKLNDKAMKLAKKDFNLNSPSQLAKVLFEDLKLPHQKKTKTGYSTDNEVLEGLLEDHELPGVALEYRQLAKLSGTYLQALPRLADPKTGKLHTHWNQNVAATGRLSSTDPNLQNIPIRTELGMQIRKAFVPVKKSDYIFSADYSQIELRVLAHYTEDAVLLKAFKEGLDIHRETAAKIFGVKAGDVTSEMRSRAKVINFGVLYGMGPFRISREFQIPLRDAKEFVENYFARFPTVAEFLASCKEEARAKGYIATLLGRRRYIPEIKSANRVIREAGERVATNLPIQGSAADLIKKAMLAVQEMIVRKKARSRMTMQVHDELVFDLAKEEKDWFPDEVSRLMKNAMKLKCPLDVGIGIGRSWYDAKA